MGLESVKLLRRPYLLLRPNDINVFCMTSIKNHLLPFVRLTDMPERLFLPCLIQFCTMFNSGFYFFIEISADFCLFELSPLEIEIKIIRE